MTVQYTTAAPISEPTAQLRLVMKNFRPVFGDPRHLAVRDKYEFLLRLYREIKAQEDRRTTPRARDKRRLTQKELDAAKLEKALIAEIRVLKREQTRKALGLDTKHPLKSN